MITGFERTMWNWRDEHREAPNDLVNKQCLFEGDLFIVIENDMSKTFVRVECLSPKAGSKRTRGRTYRIYDDKSIRPKAA